MTIVMFAYSPRLVNGHSIWCAYYLLNVSTPLDGGFLPLLCVVGKPKLRPVHPVMPSQWSGHGLRAPLRKNRSAGYTSIPILGTAEYRNYSDPVLISFQRISSLGTRTKL